jgi:hypothetical protein
MVLQCSGGNKLGEDHDIFVVFSQITLPHANQLSYTNFLTSPGVGGGGGSKQKILINSLIFIMLKVPSNIHGIARL